MTEITFVILNYNLYKETMQCVSSIIENIDTNNYHIIIVDNASPNGAGKALREIYADNRTVEVILLPENIGFARGNNVGIERARKEGTNYICCINDDAKLISKNFLSVIKNRYEQNRMKPAVIGPQIINPDGKIDEFVHPFKTISEYERVLTDLKKETFEEYFKKHKITIKYRVRKIVDRNTLLKIVFRKIKLKVSHVDPYEKKELKYTTETYDLVMSGCCLIFTPAFFDHLDGFNNRTFLYYEEEFLYADLTKHHLHSLYCPNIEIYHQGGVSTSTETKNKALSKWIFRKKHFVASLDAFVIYLKGNSEEIYHNG